MYINAQRCWSLSSAKVLMSVETLDLTDNTTFQHISQRPARNREKKLQLGISKGT